MQESLCGGKFRPVQVGLVKPVAREITYQRIMSKSTVASFYQIQMKMVL